MHTTNDKQQCQNRLNTNTNTIVNSLANNLGNASQILPSGTSVTTLIIINTTGSTIDLHTNEL